MNFFNFNFMSSYQYVTEITGNFIGWDEVFAFTHDTESTMLACGRLSGRVSVGCCAHVLQLCVMDAVKEPKVAQMLSMARKVEDYFRNTPTAARALAAQQLEERRILVENQTRWDSEFISLSRLHEQRDAIIAATTDLGQGAPALEEDQWATLAQVLDVLSRVRHVSSRLQDRDLNLADCAPMIQTLINGLSVDDFTEPWLASFIGILRTSLQNRFNKFILSEKSPGMLACALDHRFKHLSWVGDSERAALIKRLKQNVKALAVPSTPVSFSRNTQTVAPSLPLINPLFIQSLPCTDPVDYEFDKEVDNFLESSTIGELNLTALDYWSKNQYRYPNVFQLAVRMLSVQATSTESERAFSVAVQLTEG